MRQDSNVLWSDVFRDHPRDKLEEGAWKDDGDNLNNMPTASHKVWLLRMLL